MCLFFVDCLHSEAVNISTHIGRLRGLNGVMQQKQWIYFAHLLWLRHCPNFTPFPTDFYAIIKGCRAEHVELGCWVPILHHGHDIHDIWDTKEGLTSVNLSFHFCKMELILVLVISDYSENTSLNVKEFIVISRK